MATEHTPEPWIYAMPDFDHEGIICGRHGGQVIDGEFNEANARRIVACVNACEDILDYELSLGCVARLSEQLRTITKQRDKLLAAMIHIQQVACSGSPELGIATNAIASVKEKQNGN